MAVESQELPAIQCHWAVVATARRRLHPQGIASVARRACQPKVELVRLVEVVSVAVTQHKVPPRVRQVAAQIWFALIQQALRVGQHGLHDLAQEFEVHILQRRILSKAARGFEAPVHRVEAEVRELRPGEPFLDLTYRMQHWQGVHFGTDSGRELCDQGIFCRVARVNLLL